MLLGCFSSSSSSPSSSSFFFHFFFHGRSFRKILPAAVVHSGCCFFWCFLSLSFSLFMKTASYFTFALLGSHIYLMLFCGVA